MNLMEFQGSKTTLAKKALKEHFEVDLDLNKMDQKKTRSMLSRVTGLLKEARRSGSVAQTSPSYLKLVMMEQMLSNHYQDIRVQTSIVVENEEVEKSQVILAAQDLVDQIQKMIEQVSKMNAEELPAVVNGISNEIGTSESETYNQSTSQSLTTLLQSLSTAKSDLTSSLGQITGAESAEAPEAFDAGVEDGEMDADLGMGDETAMDVPEPEEISDLSVSDETDEIGSAGRELR
jgi:hypothetical protein